MIIFKRLLISFKVNDTELASIYSDLRGIKLGYLAHTKNHLQNTVKLMPFVQKDLENVSNVLKMHEIKYKQILVLVINPQCNNLLLSSIYQTLSNQLLVSAIGVNIENFFVIEVSEPRIAEDLLKEKFDPMITDKGVINASPSTC